jgi:hypothetical protein
MKFSKEKKDPNLKLSTQDKIINWNKARLKTGRFNDQLGGGKLQEQENNLRTAKQVSVSDMQKMGYDIPSSATGAYGYDDHVYTASPTIMDRLMGRKNSTKIHEEAHASLAIPQENKIKEIQKKSGRELYDYYDDPKEIYSKIMELRINNNINPNKIFKKEDIPSLKKKTSRFGEVFLEHIPDEELLDLLNNVASKDDLSKKNYT